MTRASIALIASLLFSAPSAEQHFVDQIVAQTDAPAAVIAVRSHGASHVAAAGFADLSTKRRARAAERVWIGSVTKTFTATLVLQLAAAGKLSLSDTVDRWLEDAGTARRITIKQLLAHRSGLADYLTTPEVEKALARHPSRRIPAERLIHMITRRPLEFAPGSQSSYSNTNYLLLGRIAALADARTLYDAMRARIFRPLRIDAGFVQNGVARMSGYSGGRDVTAETLGGPWGDGAVASSMLGLTNFYGALLGGRLLGQKYLRLMTTVDSSSGLGLGIAREHAKCGVDYWGHGGSAVGYETLVLASRDGRTIVAAAANGDGHTVAAALFAHAETLYCALMR
jgi:D-alanyl-D-alanine carboxypeptidase